MQSGLQVIPSRIDGQQRRQPQKHNADLGHDRHHRVAGVAGNEKADGDELQIGKYKLAYLSR